MKNVVETTKFNSSILTFNSSENRIVWFDNFLLYHFLFRFRIISFHLKREMSNLFIGNWSVLSSRCQKIGNSLIMTVAINSLDKNDSDYREDLATSIQYVGSIFNSWTWLIFELFLQFIKLCDFYFLKIYWQ
jgi:hypothetical protein